MKLDLYRSNYIYININPLKIYQSGRINLLETHVKQVNTNLSRVPPPNDFTDLWYRVLLVEALVCNMRFISQTIYAWTKRMEVGKPFVLQLCIVELGSVPMFSASDQRLPRHESNTLVVALHSFRRRKLQQFGASPFLHSSSSGRWTGLNSTVCERFTNINRLDFGMNIMANSEWGFGFWRAQHQLFMFLSEVNMEKFHAYSPDLPRAAAAAANWLTAMSLSLSRTVGRGWKSIARKNWKGSPPSLSESIS